MIMDTHIASRLGIGSLSLLLAVAVYCFARVYPPELLGSFHAASARLAAHTEIFGSAPSLLYTLALGLFVGACAATPNGARLHCLAWLGLSLILEFSQHPSIAEPLSGYLATAFPDSSWQALLPYWTRGVFDPLDLAATLLGGMIALALLDYLPQRATDANN